MRIIFEDCEWDYDGLRREGLTEWEIDDLPDTVEFEDIPETASELDIDFLFLDRFGAIPVSRRMHCY